MVDQTGCYNWKLFEVFGENHVEMHRMVEVEKGAVAAANEKLLGKYQHSMVEQAMANSKEEDD